MRPASSADLSALVEIEAAWTTTPGWTREHFEEELASPRSYLAVHEEEGRVAGYAGYQRIPPEAQVTTVAVRPDLAGRGLGRRLVGHLVESARREGLTRMTLEVSEKNEPALKLYKTAGFKVVGRRAKFYNDASDALLMDLILS